MDMVRCITGNSQNAGELATVRTSHKSKLSPSFLSHSWKIFNSENPQERIKWLLVICIWFVCMRVYFHVSVFRLFRSFASQSPDTYTKYLFVNLTDPFCKPWFYLPINRNQYEHVHRILCFNFVRSSEFHWFMNGFYVWFCNLKSRIGKNSVCR